MEKLISDPYFDIGDSEDIVLSNSALNTLDPELGGNPKKFINFFDIERQQNIGIALERGTLIHDWADKQHEFEVADFNLPEPAVVRWVDAVFDQFGIEATEDHVFMIFEVEKIDGRLKKPETIWKKWLTGEEYWDFKIKAENKNVITAATREVLNGCIHAIKIHPRANYILSTKQEIANIEHISELVLRYNLANIPFKSKLDKVIIDHEKKEIIITDLKTIGGGNVYGYAPYKLIPNTSDSIIDLYLKKFSFFNRKVYRQLALYGLGFRKYASEKDLPITDYTIKYKIIVISQSNFDVAVYNVPYYYINNGVNEIKSLINLYEFHKERGFNYTKAELENNYEIDIPHY